MAGNYKIPFGMALRHQGKRIVFRKRAKDPGKSYLFEDSELFQYRFTGEELSVLRDSGALPDWVEQPRKADGDSSAAGRTTWDNSNEEERSETEWKIDYCMGWEAIPGTPRSERGLPPVIEQVHARRKLEAEAEGRPEPPPPCPGTLKGWLRKWLAGGRVSSALISQVRQRGNRRTKLLHSVNAELLEYIDEHYLTSRRLPIATIHQEFEKLLDSDLSLPNRRKAPSYAAVVKAVHDLCEYTVVYCREGARTAFEEFRYVGPGLFTERHNEVWEIDDTRVDLICVAEDGRTPIGRPWLIAVIDRHTRMLMAFEVSFNPPDTTAVLEALKVAMLRKDEMLRAAGIFRPYLAHGRPDDIHVDNAKHYNSKVLKGALARLGIRLQTMPVLKAWYKGTVERLFGTVSRQVFHVVPGTTHSGIYERDKEVPPETVAEATIAELRLKLLDWVVNKYQVRHHRGIDASPEAMWKASLKNPKNEERFPTDRGAIEAALSLTAGRRVRKTGIEFKYLVYTSPLLNKLLTRSKNEAVDDLVIRIDRKDLTKIHFEMPGTQEWEPAYLRSDLLSRVRGRTLEEYDLARAYRRGQTKEFCDGDKDFEQTYAVMEESRLKNVAGKKLGNRARAEGARERMLDQADRMARLDRGPGPGEGGDLGSLVSEGIEGMPAVAPVQVPLPAAPVGSPPGGVPDVAVTDTVRATAAPDRDNGNPGGADNGTDDDDDLDAWVEARGLRTVPNQPDEES